MRRNLQQSNLVVEKPPHGEPVQRLIASPADAAVVHVSGHCHTQPLLTAPEENDNVILGTANALHRLRIIPSPRYGKGIQRKFRRGLISRTLMTLYYSRDEWKWLYGKLWTRDFNGKGEGYVRWMYTTTAKLWLSWPSVSRTLNVFYIEKLGRIVQSRCVCRDNQLARVSRENFLFDWKFICYIKLSSSYCNFLESLI